MKRIVMKVVLTTNLTVVMDLVSMTSGNVMVGQTAQMAQMKLTVKSLHVLIKDYGIVAMANVSLHHMYVMDLLNLAMLDGVLTVQTVQMKL
jgi:hypothetical protein